MSCLNRSLCICLSVSQSVANLDQSLFFWITSSSSIYKKNVFTPLVNDI